jgi:hypothetical protein
LVPIIRAESFGRASSHLHIPYGQRRSLRFPYEISLTGIACEIVSLGEEIPYHAIFAIRVRLSLSGSRRLIEARRTRPDVVVFGIDRHPLRPELGHERLDRDKLVGLPSRVDTVTSPRLKDTIVHVENAQSGFFKFSGIDEKPRQRRIERRCHDYENGRH